MKPRPIANAVSATVAFNSANNPITLNITGGTPTSISTPTLPSHGTISVNGLAIVYTPASDYFGADSFTYAATNGIGTSAAAKVTITIPGPLLPMANAVSATVAPNSTNNPITLNITAGTPIAVVTPTLPAHGTISVSGLAIRYTPAPNYAGLDSFTYAASNLGGTSSPAKVSITIPAPSLPIANAVSVTVARNSTNNPITLNITGGPAAFLVTPTQPAHGTISLSGLSIKYTPGPNYSGPDSFTYAAINPGGASAPAKVTITVTP